MDWRKYLCSAATADSAAYMPPAGFSLTASTKQLDDEINLLLVQIPPLSHCRCIFYFNFYFSMYESQQRVQRSWTQMGTLEQRQTASLSWLFTLTQTAVAAGVGVWETVTPTARGAQGVSSTRRHHAWSATFAVHITHGWLHGVVCVCGCVHHVPCVYIGVCISRSEHATLISCQTSSLNMKRKAE